MIIQKSSGCSLHIKLMLFRTYCTCCIAVISGACAVFRYPVAYGNTFRYLLSEARWCSASALFVSYYVPIF